MNNVGLKTHNAEGVIVEGTTYDALAYSNSTGGEYEVRVVFIGDEATVYFPEGGNLTLDLEDVDDPHNILAYDFERGGHWDLVVLGLD
jgi:hypothetical protein